MPETPIASGWLSGWPKPWAEMPRQPSMRSFRPACTSGTSLSRWTGRTAAAAMSIVTQHSGMDRLARICGLR